MPNFVASTTSSRRPAIARPTSSSLVYGPYMSAVSRKCDAELERAVDRGDRLVLVARAVELGHAHAAEAEGGDGRALEAQRACLHAGHRYAKLTLNVKCYVLGKRAARRARGTLSAVPDLELTRDPEDRRRYVLDGVGSLRLEGWGGQPRDARRRRALVAGRPRGLLEAARRGRPTPRGTPVADFEPRSFKRGGILRVGGRELRIAPASRWKERYALKDGERELAVLEAKSWGKRPIRVAVDDPAAVEPLLLLFAAFVARKLAEDAAASGA